MTSRSTWLKDESPKARPEMIPANDKRRKHMNRISQNMVWQHGSSSSLIVNYYFNNKIEVPKKKEEEKVIMS